MKKFGTLLALILVLSVSMCSLGFAEEIDAKSMDYESLFQLKQAVDLELYSRPEAGPFTLAPGFYTVDTDIKAGRYFVIAKTPGEDSYVRFHVYATRQKYDERPAGYYGEYIVDELIHIGEQPISVSLESGNYLYIQYASLSFSVSEFNDDDFYVYTPPEGTYIPAGAYLVGENGDIPAGTYSVYAGTISGGDIKLYLDESTYTNDGSWHLGYDKHYEVSISSDDAVATLKVVEGNLILVEKDVVMKRQRKLSFD